MRVAVLGAGYAGVTAVRALESALPDDVELVIVDEDDVHLVQHELHRVVRRPDFADDIAVPLDEVVDRATVRRARIDAVDANAGRATLADGGTIDYDFGVVCLGAEADFHGLEGVREHAVPLKRLDDARRIRERALDLVRDGGTAVVGGAGLSGVQVAGELHALAAGADARDRIEIVLLERLDDVAPTFPGPFRTAVREELESRGVEVRTGMAVRGADADEIETDAGPLPYDLFVWTGGIRGTAAMGADRPTVPDTLRIARPTFVAGDAARVVDRDGEPAPPSAQTAVRQGRVAAENVRRLVAAERSGGAVFEPRLRRYAYAPRGWIVSVGDGAVAMVGPTVLRGAPALALKTTVGVGHLSSVSSVRRAVAFAVDEFGGG